jgi:hypothetical protein
MGLFNSKKEKKYELPPKLEMLLDMVVKDGEVTEKELATLRAEAAKHDISEGELDIILKSRLPKKKKEEKPAEVKFPSEEVASTIQNNLPNEADSVETVCNKYDELCELTGKNLQKEDAEKLHKAQLKFIRTIATPKTKEEILELVTRIQQYIKQDSTKKVVKSVLGIGTKVAGLIPNPATMILGGIDNETLDGISGFASKMFTSKKAELTNAWITKRDAIIANAKKQFGSDKQFTKELNELTKEKEKGFNNLDLSLLDDF